MTGEADGDELPPSTYNYLDHIGKKDRSSVRPLWRERAPEPSSPETDEEDNQHSDELPD